MKKSVKELVPTYTIDPRDSVAEALEKCCGNVSDGSCAKEKQKRA